MKEKDRSLNWINLVIGLSFLVFGLLFIITETIGNSVNRTAKAEGTVVGKKVKFMGEGNASFPTVKFVTEGVRSIVFTNNTDGGRVGESVTVRYDPADPTDARIDSVSWPFVPAIFIVVGGILTFSYIRRRGKFPGAPEPDANQNG